MMILARKPVADLFRISVFISGGGTTLKNLIEYQQRQASPRWEISSVLSNRVDAGGLEFARNAGIATQIVSHRDFDGVERFSDAIYDALAPTSPDLIVMGGFLRRVKVAPAFENRIINIHPSLIPSFCGKGNYGLKVHQAVIDYGCRLTGCTVHFVDDQYDHGPIIAQRPVDVVSSDDAKTLAARVFDAECQIYPAVIDAIADGRVSVSGRRVEIHGTI